jgi:nucleoside-diphosphate-sugar epimerase
MLFVEDAVRQVLTLADASQPQLAGANIEGNREHTVAEIAEAFARIAGIRPKNAYIRSSAVQQWAKLRSERSFSRSTAGKVHTPLVDGLAKTLSWFRESSPQYV